MKLGRPKLFAGNGSACETECETEKQIDRVGPEHSDYGATIFRRFVYVR